MFENTNEDTFSYTDGSNDKGIDFFVVNDNSYKFYQCKSTDIDLNPSGKVFDATPVNELDEAISYNDNHIEKVYFVIFPYPDGGWAAQCVPPKENKMGQLKPFPKSWSGLTGINLENESRIKGASLCLNFRFFAKAQSKEAILEMCKLAIKE